MDLLQIAWNREETLVTMKWLYVFALSVALVASENPEGNAICSCFVF